MKSVLLYVFFYKDQRPSYGHQMNNNYVEQRERTFCAVRVHWAKDCDVKLIDRSCLLA